MQNVACSTEQKVRFTAQPKTQSGAPASLDGNLGAVVDDPAAGSVEPGNGSLDVVVRPAPGFVGTISGRVVGDAGLGSGVVELAEPFEIVVTSAMASNLGVSANVEPA